jgi:ABC-2 type transport system ATP-binding protein
MTASIIKIKSLVKQFNKAEHPSLDGIDLDIFEGEKFGFFGPNGAGKTTIISILCNIIHPSSGSVNYFLDDKELSVKEILPHIGFVPQDFAFYPELSPVQNLRYFGSLYEVPKKELDVKIDSLLSILGLSHVRNKKINTFSGGMKRRINLAIGLINEPKILFLDEPTVGVDVQSKLVIITLLEELNKKGTTIIYTSHHLKEAEDFCDRIALLDNGKIIAFDTLQNLRSQNEVTNLEDLLIKLTGKTLRD